MADAGSQSLKPLSLRREGDGLLIEWNDDVRTFIAWKELRTQCPCATCLDERAKPPNPLHILSAGEMAAGAPQPVKMAACGYYAYQITWNDGHSTGIFTLEYLRQISTPLPQADPVGGKE